MEDENRINSVLAYQDALLSEIESPDMSGVEEHRGKRAAAHRAGVRPSNHVE